MDFHIGINSRMVGYGALALLMSALGAPALAQDDEDEVIDEVIVEGSLRSLPTQDVGSVFGFDKSVLETPRSLSTVSCRKSRCT